MKKLCLAICLCLVSVMLVAQQDPIYSLYLNNPFVLNPAYAGLQNNLSTSASFRQQWAGLAGSPTTINANGHMSLFKNTMGTGLLLTSDQTGSTDVTGASGRPASMPDPDAAWHRRGLVGRIASEPDCGCAGLSRLAGLSPEDASPLPVAPTYGLRSLLMAGSWPSRERETRESRMATGR